MDRRAFLVAGGVGLVSTSAWAAMRKIEPRHSETTDPLHDAIARIEAESGGRLGVALHDTGTGRRFAYRGNERFAMCSTFKLLLAGAVLARVQQRAERLDRRLPIQGSDVIGHAPFAAKRAGGSATVAELCRAMVVESDNGAANLMLAAIGGPAALTRFLRQIGDPTTRLDRTEPTLNEATPGDSRDTTTPLAMLGSAKRLWLGPVLAPPHRAQLTAWAIECRTGLERLRAGLPKDWRAGDKTGTGDRGTYNDVAIFWPPRRRPMLVTSYLSESKLGTDAGNAVHAQVARALVGMI
ncbi:MAG: class A beta-lactamase [Sphingomonas sp.]